MSGTDAHKPAPDPAPEHGSGSAPGHDHPLRREARKHEPAATAVFEAGELAIALSHFDVGVISEIRPIRRGSGDSPKAILKTSRGALMLKRRGRHRSNLERVAFSHRLQIHLASRGYPLPRLLGTRDENSSILRLGDRLYELFEYVAGDPYSGSEPETRAAGRALAILHRLTADFDAEGAPQASGYHASAAVERSLEVAGERLPEEESPVAGRLLELYRWGRDRAESLGYGKWPRQVIHGDWHPGNVVFRGGDVSAALDYDAARIDARAADAASGALQFSLVRSGFDLGSWSAEPDEGRLRAFLGGYDAVVGCRLSDSKLEALAPLMIESLIAEAAGPVAETGSFGRHDGAEFLRMIERKAGWLHEQQDRVRGSLDGPSG